MQRFAVKSNRLQRSASARPASAIAASAAASRLAFPFLGLQSAVGNQTAMRFAHAKDEGLEAGRATLDGNRFAHDFSRIPLHASALVAIQRKLTTSVPGDHLEQEADTVAAEIMRQADHEASGPLALTRRTGDDTVRRWSQEREAERPGNVEANESEGSTTRTGSEVESAVHALHGHGSPLPESACAFFEPKFGYSFAAVRIHSESKAAALARNFHARAFALDRHIVFGSGEYAPGTREGRRLLAHELAHVVQQGKGRALVGHRGRPVAPAAASPAVQFDLARPVASPEAEAGPLTPEQIRTAIRFNQSRFADPYVFAVMRDVLGVSRFPAVVDEEFVQAIAGWQAQNKLPQDGRLTARTTATIVAELRAEGALVPQLLRDALRVELEPAFTFNEQQNFDRRTITIFQALVAAPSTGVWDDATIQQIMVWQGRHGVTADGMVGPDTLRTLILELTASALFDDAIHVIVDAHHFPTTNLAAIAFDATVTGADAETTGVIGAGQPQTVRVGPSAFAADYAHMIRIIGHELQHVQQRSGAAPIANQHVREFLAFAWEALSMDAPSLAAAERVNHANIAITHWNAAPVADRTPHQAVRDRLDRLIAAGGVGNF